MNRIYTYLFCGIIAVLLFSCSVSKESFTPTKKYGLGSLQSDYQMFRNVLEESHPSLYWFISQDSMNYYFDYGYSQLSDSMTEPEFRKVLSYVSSKIKCGHTSVKSSKQFARFIDTVPQKIFPLSLKVWPDSVVVVANLNRKDSALRRGTLIKSINGYPVQQLTDTFFQYMVTDGNALTGKYQSLSNRGSYGSMYRTVFGFKDSLKVSYIDTIGDEQLTQVALFDPAKDSMFRNFSAGLSRATRDEVRTTMLLNTRHLQIDTVLSSAYMMVNTFARGNKLRRFFRECFEELEKRKIRHLVVDVRSNGGGDASLSTLLTRYLADHKFKLADSLYAVKRSSDYGKHMEKNFVYWSAMQFITKKKKDGKYHFGYFERHYFHPKKNRHYSGNVYILTGGNSFSATTLFASALKGQSNVLIVGEETGGGAYGNSAWMIPDVTLPNTKVRFRLPKFRLVMDKDAVSAGRGVMPDIEAAPTLESIRRGIDPKIEKVKELIISSNLTKK